MPRSILSSFTPLDLPNLVGWWDFSDASTITLNGSDISQIDDKSPKANHLAQATATKQPARITAGQNGFDTADFIAADSNILSKASAVFSIGTGDAYLVMAVEMDIITTNSYAFAIDEALWKGWNPSMTGNDPRMWDGAAGKAWASLNVAVNTPALVEFWRSGTALTCRVDKVSDTDSQTSSTNWGVNTPINIGARVDGSFHIDGEVFEMVFCDGLPSAAERDDNADYLLNKWGI